MTQSRFRPVTVCVVDSQPDDFHDWRTQAEGSGVKVVVAATAAEALKAARSEPIDLWVVNADLPGLSGLELCAMLRTAPRSVPVMLVADRYSPELERAAWGVGATSFVCKPTHNEWLGQWLRARNSVNKPADPLRRAADVSPRE